MKATEQNIKELLTVARDLALFVSGVGELKPFNPAQCAVLVDRYNQWLERWADK